MRASARILIWIGIAALTVSTPAWATSVIDRVGDAVAVFGAPGPLIDIDAATVTRTGPDLHVVVTFHNAILPASSNAPNALFGGFDFDFDRNAATGDPPLQNHFSPPFTMLDFGSDVSVDFFSEIVHPGFVDVFDNISLVLLATIPVTFTGTSVSYFIPLSLIRDQGGSFYFTATFGTVDQPTDALDIRAAVPEPPTSILLLMTIPILLASFKRRQSVTILPRAQKWPPIIACLLILTAAVGSFGAPRQNAVSGRPLPATLLQGTVVTMNASRDVIPDGRVLIRDGRIVAVWSGARPPRGISTDGAERVDLGESANIYPGLINLHDHPFYGALPLWRTPSSHQQASIGRPAGTEPYANRYQWNQVGVTSPFEYRRLVDSPQLVLNLDSTLKRSVDVVKFAKTRMILGGTTTTQGAIPNASYDTLLSRNLESLNFGRQRIVSRVSPIAAATPAEVSQLNGAMALGLVDAFVVHLAEGVRDADRRPGDSTSSRGEFADLKAKRLLNDRTVIVHGIALEPSDFADMANAPAAFGPGNGRGASLVWSPLSNLLLYGTTTATYDALAAGVEVSLGTDWTPSGSPNLLTELKIADIALRDEAVLGRRRYLVPEFALDGRGADHRRKAESALDRLLVEMVTINPARAVRWDDQVGSIEAGKVADLLVIATSDRGRSGNNSDSVYRELIDVTERDVRLVLVGGQAVGGDVQVMTQLKPGDFEVVRSADGCFEKAVDVTDARLPGGTETLAQVTKRIRDGLRALGGDFPPPGGGPSSPFANTWNYLKTNFLGTAELPDSIFNFGLGANFGFAPNMLVNLEGITLPPFFTEDDDWWFATLGRTNSSTPPYGQYSSNSNQVTRSGDPFQPRDYERRWYRPKPCRTP